MSQKTKIAIVGAGFSGVVTAVHLLRAGCSVTLINRSGRMARGVAYGTNTPEHVLNVPAGRMSAFPDVEDSFLRFARERDASISSGSFVSRSLYGEYLEQILADAERAAPSGAKLERIVGQVTDINVAQDNSSVDVTVTDEQSVHADRVVLALGNFAPADPPVHDRSFYSSARYVRDAWASDALSGIDGDDSVLLIGTGLTMYDVSFGLSLRGLRRPMYAISRRGLLAQSHRAGGHPPPYNNFPQDLNRTTPTVSNYLRAVREEIRQHSAEGGDWRDVIASLRPATPALWHALSNTERARFVRHLLPFWDAHRHRVAPQAASAANELISSGKLVVVAGRIVRLQETLTGVTVTWRPRGSASTIEREFTRVINCTGPAANLAAAGEPLVDKLLERGTLTPDDLRLGVQVTDNGALVDSDGNPSEVMFYIGPLLKARHLEATAVPELREHAARLAQHLLESLPGRNG